MNQDSIMAYELPDRVRRYDNDMDIMHPLRRKMIEMALEILPFGRQSKLRALDLGVGTGLFSQRFLENYYRASIVAVDGAESMIDLARFRLGDLCNRVEFVVADFRALPRSILNTGEYDVVLSSYALHHLSAKEKCRVVRSVISALKPHGWFINADIFVAENSIVEERFQQLRIQGVVARAPEGDERFNTAETARAFLDRLEADENDQPQTLAADIAILSDSGLNGTEVFWKEYREAVIGGPKGPMPPNQRMQRTSDR